MTNTKRTILFTLPFSLCLFMLTIMKAYAVPEWFSKGETIRACMATVNKPLVYRLKGCTHYNPVGICDKTEERDVTIPDNPNNRQVDSRDIQAILNPGAGKCCIFDDTGTIKGAILTAEGNNECRAFMQNKGAQHYGIWWLVSSNPYRLDWWYGQGQPSN